MAELAIRWIEKKPNFRESALPRKQQVIFEGTTSSQFWKDTEKVALLLQILLTVVRELHDDWEGVELPNIIVILEAKNSYEPL